MAKKRKATKKKATKRKPAKKKKEDTISPRQLWKRKGYDKRVRIESVDGDVITATLRSGVPKKRIGQQVTFDKKDLLAHWEIV